jgi:ribosomal protein S25
MAELDAAWRSLSSNYIKDPVAEGWVTPEQYAKKFGMTAGGARMFLIKLANEGKVAKMMASYQGKRRSFYRPILGAR